jgi:hypothetical protein
MRSVRLLLGFKSRVITMSEWLTSSFQEHSIFWLLISSALGGVIGASLRFLFDVLLPQRLKDRQDIIAAKRKYATPILLAADDLRKRCASLIQHIDLIEKEEWLSPQEPNSYYNLSTLYTVAQFMGWRQILRHTVVYLDFTTTAETRRYENFLVAIQRGFTKPDLLQNTVSSDPSKSKDKWIYTFWLQAIGDSMIVREGSEYRVKDYAAFCSSLSQSDQVCFKEWIAALGSLFINLKSADPRFRRIVATHCVLNAFVDQADPHHLRTAKQSYYWNLLSKEEAGRVKNRIRGIVPNAALR